MLTSSSQMMLGSDAYFNKTIFLCWKEGNHLEWLIAFGSTEASSQENSSVSVTSVYILLKRVSSLKPMKVNWEKSCLPVRSCTSSTRSVNRSKQTGFQEASMWLIQMNECFLITGKNYQKVLHWGSPRGASLNDYIMSCWVQSGTFFLNMCLIQLIGLTWLYKFQYNQKQILN